MQVAFQLHQICHGQKSDEVILALMHSLHQKIKFHTFYNSSEGVYLSEINYINNFGQ